MIGRLQGTLIEKQPPQLLLDVAGVGYEIELPMSSFYELPGVNETTTLLIHMVVREDAHLLYGFISHAERDLFRTLIRVNGVGPKLALAMLSGMNCHELVTALQQSDLTALMRLPGVGKKTAERLVIEMADRLQGWQATSPLGEKGGYTPVQATHNAHDDAISALISLGYKPVEASRLVQQVATDDMDSEAVIRAALRQAVSR
ncbi:MAG: Holliday junction branch migration protein RuvA [Gammaproteobacteria bacterium]|nr:Holliday junction branch migration protein RuvA [Gammaproteobacteria bacterium]